MNPRGAQEYFGLVSFRLPLGTLISTLCLPDDLILNIGLFLLRRKLNIDN
jgi:hypothetical protein